MVEALEQALLAAARKKYGTKQEIEARFNEEAGEVELFQFKTVVKDVKNPPAEISIEEAKDLDADVEVGDSLGTKIDISDFGRIAAQTAKQVIIQRVKDAERENIFDDFKDRKGEVISGTVQRFERGSIIVNLGRAEAVIPQQELIPRESYKPGDRIRAYRPGCSQNSERPSDYSFPEQPQFLDQTLRVGGAGDLRGNREDHQRRPGARESGQDRRLFAGFRCGPRGGLRGDERVPGPGGGPGTPGRKD